MFIYNDSWVSGRSGAYKGNIMQNVYLQILTISLPIFAGIVGYFIIYWNSWRLEKRKAELKLVNDQLQYLYGPLFASNEAGSRAVAALMERHTQTKFFSSRVIAIRRLT